MKCIVGLPPYLKTISRDIGPDPLLTELTGNVVKWPLKVRKKSVMELWLYRGVMFEESSWYFLYVVQHINIYKLWDYHQIWDNYLVIEARSKYCFLRYSRINWKPETSCWTEVYWEWRPNISCLWCFQASTVIILYWPWSLRDFFLLCIKVYINEYNGSEVLKPVVHVMIEFILFQISNVTS